MIGAYKIDEHSDDLERLFKLFDQGLSNSKIAREFTTNSNHTLSRTHISQTRRGLKWNPQRRSFLMKTELEQSNNVTTKLKNNTFRTEVGILATESIFYYVFLDYKNDQVINNSGVSLMNKKPTVEEILEHHKNIIK